MKLLFVCMGNICRSPTAEGVMRARLEAAGLAGWQVDSAGTHGYHVGEAPDPRTRQAAASRGYALCGRRARQIETADFARFDLILAADRRNLRELKARCPAEHRHKLTLMLEVLDGAVDEVPDPYCGDAQAFDTVLDLIEAACDGWLTRLRRE
ncbi:low molecular weight protein-tyrosine-phosphatase [Crenobacter cavernae]|uniref:protein-tyrosine-phosphatase n=1 Tax=Crenobacter cavernae TaxID=2290923 RepID=A0A345Y773_9NEIS|nr:low molecular weight protein-tyrosine-phosphatase [Crenobacter cavernae]AXK39775.1 low molecular weight phosphotyrosine protein phosphatase [Crenobacter cavernae]